MAASRVAVAGTIVVLLALSACSLPAPTGIGRPERTATAEPAYECLEVSPGAISGLEWGLDDKQPGFDIVQAAAIKNPSSDLSWFVAAEFSGPGVDSAIGVWSTLYDPTVDRDNAYSSVDSYAAAFSSYYQTKGYSSALDGVDEVKDCLR